jgi:transcriptional regulator with XRE-family HTH domain
VSRLIDLGVSQKVLAKKMGITETWFSRWVNASRATRTRASPMQWPAKLALSVLAWVVVVVILAAAFDVTYGVSGGYARPGVVSRYTVLLLIPILALVWWRRPIPRWLRELTWATGCSLAFALFVVIDFIAGLETFRPSSDDRPWSFVVFLGAVIILRLVAWAITARSRRAALDGIPR